MTRTKSGMRGESITFWGGILEQANGCKWRIWMRNLKRGKKAGRDQKNTGDEGQCESRCKQELKVISLG